MSGDKVTDADREAAKVETCGPCPGVCEYCGSENAALAIKRSIEIAQERERSQKPPSEVFFGNPDYMRCWQQNEDGSTTEYRLRWEPVGQPSEADRLRAALIEIASLDYRECDDSDDDALCSGAREAAKLAREAVTGPNDKCPGCGGRNVTINGSLMTCHDCADKAKRKCEGCAYYRGKSATCEPPDGECYNWEHNRANGDKS